MSKEIKIAILEQIIVRYRQMHIQLNSAKGLGLMDILAAVTGRKQNNSVLQVP